MQFKTDGRVTAVSLLGLAGPDIVRFFEQAGPVLDGLVRLGQVAVAIATVYYIFRKAKNIRSNRRSKKKTV